MTISNKLITINSALADIKTSIISKGQTPSGDITTYAEAINSLNVVEDKTYLNYWITTNGIININNDTTFTITGSNEYKDDLTIIGLNFANIRAINGFGEGTFRDCQNLKFINFDNIETIDGKVFWMFRNCQNLTSINFPKLKIFKATDSGGAQMFCQCIGLKNVEFPMLEESRGGSGIAGMFYNCSGLEYVSFPMLNKLTGSYKIDLQNLFRGCTNLKDVFFPSLCTSSFTNQNTNVMQYMLFDTGTNCIHTIHFPSNLETLISTFTTYPLFGGTSGYVTLAFDLPATS